MNREDRQNEAWCIRLLMAVSKSERAMVASAINVFNRVKSERGIKKIHKIISGEL